MVLGLDNLFGRCNYITTNRSIFGYKILNHGSYNKNSSKGRLCKNDGID